MPYRAFPVWVTLLGVVTVAFCLLFRVDLRRAADSGPAFLRRLLLAGMMCLYGLGVISPAVGAENDRWQKLGTTWQEAEEVASGKRGPFPFDRAGKTKILRELEELKLVIDTLVVEKVITEPEAELLKLDLQVLESGVGEKRPKELEVATCYEPMMLTPELDSLDRLEKRLPLLTRLETGKVSPEVWKRVTAGLQRDIAVLTSPDHIARLQEPDKKRAADIAERARKEIERLGQPALPVTSPGQ